MDKLEPLQAVRFTNANLHKQDKKYPPKGAIGTVIDYTRPGHVKVKWREADTCGDGVWVCDENDLEAVSYD